ncbi:MAG: methyl-accepting chemotaxis protein [Bdellovibrionales bacterium]|nr:methyl-accepting chemotaxis protein [Bdellovibrionales bacterium]
MKLNMKLQSKVLSMIGLPLLALAVTAGMLVTDAGKTKSAAGSMATNAKVMGTLSQTVSTIQLARARSIMYVTGKISQSDLAAQRAEANQKVKAMQDLLKEVDYDKSISDGIQGALAQLPSIRSDVDEKKDAGGIGARFTGVIADLIRQQVAIAKKDKLDGIEAKLVSVTMLESARESAGQMRALGNATLGSNAPIPPEQAAKLRSLSVSVDVLSGSSALDLPPDAHKEIEKFRSGESWKKTRDIVGVILAKANEGKYGIEATEYFAASTAAIGEISKAVEASLGAVIAVADSASAAASTAFLVILIGACAGVLVLSLVAWNFVRRLSGDLTGIASSLGANTDELNQVAVRVAEASTELSSSATEQASALQETVSSIDEVSAMVSKNADNAKKSQDVSLVSQKEAEKGKHVVTEMIQSIEEINRSNTEIVQQIEKSNTEISNIVKVITEIGNKTKVINDIVFQTKLLSFNASVEAARAGEHGKGFAVVAEEVGNLAQMSGNAAKEISQMLDSSIQKVESIVTESSQRVERLVATGKEKVEAGSVTARKCGEVLDEIVKNVTNCSHMVSEIATASQEQSQGVTEITKAMNQLDQVTQQNAAASQQAASSAEQLRSQSGNLKQMAAQLNALVEGRATDVAPAAAAPASERSAKVMPFPQKESRAKARAEAPSVELKKVVGGGSPVPLANDGRFEEV